MNLALRGIEADFGPEHADTFRRDLHPDLRADFVMANPPFNDSDWYRKDDDVRWAYGVPPKGNANFAWVQHFIHHLAPNGLAGFVLANGALSATGPQGAIKRAIVDADLVDCIVMLPPKLFYTLQLPVSLWFLSKNKSKDRSTRTRSEETLFIDARKCYEKADVTHNELTDSHISLISSTYHDWKRKANSSYKDQIGFCRSVKIKDIADCDYSLVSARYVGIHVDKPNRCKSQEAVELALNSLIDCFTTFDEVEKKAKQAIKKAMEAS
jgi:type I restriction enzyme M protein